MFSAFYTQFQAYTYYYRMEAHSIAIYIYRVYQLCMILPIIQIFLVDDSTNRTEEPKPNKLDTSLYENTQPPTATKDDVYEHVELKSTAAAQSEEMELSGNVAYGRVQK